MHSVSYNLSYIYIVKNFRKTSSISSISPENNGKTRQNNGKQRRTNENACNSFVFMRFS